MKTSILLYGSVSEKIIGCAMKVHRHFGLGFPEAIYKRALMLELEKEGINFKSEVEKNIYYEGYFIGKRRLELVVEDKILVELKAISVIDNSCLNQLLNYLKIFGIEVGLLLNFGAGSLQFKRLVSTVNNP
jgi:GxxExxY protein